MLKARRHGVRHRLATLMLVLAAAVLLTACGETVIDTAKTEDAIQADLKKSLHENIQSVECPAGEKVETGRTFTCTVKYADGEQATATLKIRNEDADVSFVGLETNK